MVTRGAVKAATGTQEVLIPHDHHDHHDRPHHQDQPHHDHQHRPNIIIIIINIINIIIIIGGYRPLKTDMQCTDDPIGP